MKRTPITMPQEDWLALGSYRVELIKRINLEPCVRIRDMLLSNLAEISTAMDKKIPKFDFKSVENATSNNRVARVLGASLDAIQRGTFSYPFVFTAKGDTPCVAVRLNTLLLHCMSQHPASTRGAAFGLDRLLFRRAVMSAGLVLGEVERTIDGKRWAHMSLLDEEKTGEFIAAHDPNA